MTTTEAAKKKLESALKECESHRARLNYAAEKTARLFPLTVECFDSLADEQVTLIDQLLFRFGKLQDAMGQRLFPALLMLGLEWSESESFLDKLNRLEKLGVIPSVTQWMALREQRNAAMHEYPEEPAITVRHLNRLHASVAELEQAYRQALSYARTRYGGQAAGEKG